MANISDSTKIDKAFKFVSGKGYTTTQKGVDNEDASSGFIVGTSFIFSQDAAIPTTAPGADTSVLTYYGDGSSANRFAMVYDISSPLNRAWYASTDGSTLTQMRATRVQNWVPPAFGNYTIRMFLVAGSSTSGSYLQEIFFSDATSPLFDYKTGILTFESDPLAAYSSIAGGPPVGIHISGYVYTGPLLSQVFDGNGNFTGGLSDFGTSTSLAKFVNPGKSFEISSPFALDTTWKTELTSEIYSNASWVGITQTPNGEIIAVGTSGGNAAVAYSFGHGTWYKAVSTGGAAQPNAIWAVDNDIAYFTDTANHVVQSIDSGRNWSQVATLSFTGRAIWSSSATNIYIVGTGGNIVRSTNGTTYSAQTNSNSNNLYAIWGSSLNDIYAVGASGTIRHSIGSGTWTGQTSGTANDLISIFGFSSTEIYVGGVSGTLLKSTGGGSWVGFNNGLPATFFVGGIYGISSGSTKVLYATGYDNLSNNYKIYSSNGTNNWVLQTTFSGPITQNFVLSGGLSGVVAGLDSGRIIALHTLPIETIHGHALVDGYFHVRGSIDARNADLNTLNLTTLPSTPSISVFPTSTSNYTILSAVSSDTGEGFRFWRESQAIYTLDIGSKVTNANDGVTPYAAGGRIRLGGFTNSPSTTARGEIETVSSVGLKILAYQGDFTIANMFGVSGSTIGNVNVTTQNGAINLTATGAELPSPAGRINLIPGTAAYVVLGTNTTSTKLEVNSPSGNYNRMFGNGTFANNAGISSLGPISAGTSLQAGANLIVGTTINAGGIVTAGGFNTVSGGVNAFSGSFASLSSNGYFRNNGILSINYVNFFIGYATGSIYPNASVTFAPRYNTTPSYLSVTRFGSYNMDPTNVGFVGSPSTPTAWGVTMYGVINSLGDWATWFGYVSVA